MKNILFSIALTAWIFMAQQAGAQKLSPVKWQFSVSPVGESEALLICTATMERGWHIYSQHIGKDGPLPTTFTFAPSNDYSRVGNMEEKSTAVKKYEPVFMMDVLWFESTAVFIQKVKLYVPATVISGKVEFMACREEECLLPEVVKFSMEATAAKPEKKTQER